MKKLAKRLLASFVAVLMLVSLLPVSVSAASWNPSDTITITVRVFDQSTGAYYVIGQDTCTKGDQYIQSDDYTIPYLSHFTSNTHGRVTKVVGNWYFPTHDCTEGATVNWSCNSNTATMTYWVESWSTGTGSGSGNNGNETIDYGSGSKSWSQTIVYHSNYPDGTDYEYTVNYNIKSYVTLANHYLKTYAGCGFSEPDGYVARNRVWDTAQNGTGANYGDGGSYPFEQSNDGKTIHLYAQWTPSGATPATEVTLTYMNGSTEYATQTYLKGDDATVIDCNAEKEGFTFKGWATTEGGTVAYNPADTFKINEDSTLYAVWEQNKPDPTEPSNPTDPTDPSDPTNPTEPDDGKKELPGIDKEADETSVMVGDVINYTLTSNVGVDLQEYIHYIYDENGEMKGVPNEDATYYLTFTDKLGEGLELDTSSIVVKLNGTAISGNRYEATDVTTHGFTVKVDLLSLYVDGLINEAMMGTAPVTVEYSATLVDDTPGAYTNIANIDYTGNEGEPGTGGFTVYTYGINIKKVDAETNRALGGAEFTLFQLIDGAYVPVEGYVGTTNDEGTLVFKGLKAGTYYLKETKTPEGYVADGSYIEVEVGETVSTNYYTDVTVPNTADITPPGTGGSGTMIFTICGASILVLAAAVYMVSRRKRETA